jgi:flagellar protein FliS
MSAAYLNQYRRANVASADPIDLLLMLLDEAVKCAERARLLQDEIERRRLLGKTISIVAELIGTLEVDVGGKAAWNMLRLYLYINGRLGEAIRGDEEQLPNALRILRHVRETWHEAAAMARKEAAE